MKNIKKSIELVFDYNELKYIENTKDKFLFHHLPKTAGSTFRGILSNLYKSNELCPAEITDELKECYQNNYGDYKLFGGHFSYEAINKYLSDAVWVTFLRNPIDRVISHYYNHTNKERIPQTWIDRAEKRSHVKNYIDEMEGLSLKEWLTHKNPLASKRVSNYQLQGLLSKEIKDKVQDWGVYDEKLLELAKQNLKEKFAFVGIQEYFDLSLDLFSATFALNPIDATNYTTNLNTKKSRESKYNLDEEVLSIVKEKNQMDLELYEYGVELLFERMHQINQTLLSNNRFYIMRQMNQGKKTFQNHMDVTQVYATHGFYALEGKEYRVFKWSGYQTPSIVEFLYDFELSKNYVIKIEILAVIDESILGRLKILVDDMVCSPNVSKEGNTYFISLKLSDIEKLTTSKFHTIKIFSPLQIEGDYKGARKLGIALHAIEIISSKD